MTTLRYATCNLHVANPDPGATVRKIAGLADAIGFQEVETPRNVAAVTALRKLGWDTWFGGTENRDDGSAAVAIAWDATRFRAISRGAVRAHARPESDGWGPPRWILWVVLEDLATSATFAVVNTHMIHQAWSTEPERRELWKWHATLLARTITDLWTKHRVVIGGGDVNRSKWTPTGTVGHWAYAGTFARLYYDVVFTAGTAKRTGDVRRISTLSDHDTLVATLTVPDPEETPVSRTPMTDALVAALRRRGVEVLTHADWGSQRRDVYRARLETRPHDLLPDRPVDTLWNHITVTHDDGHLVGEFKADMREVERIGYDRFGTGFSYNAGVDANATRPRVGIGQFLEARGAHTINDKGTPGYSTNQNKVSLAVAWIGVPGDRLNAHAITAMVELRAALIEIGALTKDYDDVPHSLVAAKDCPTDELRDRLGDLKHAGLARVRTNNEEDDVTAQDVWEYPIADQTPGGPAAGKPRQVGKVITNIEVNLDNQATKLNAVAAEQKRQAAEQQKQGELLAEILDALKES